MRARGGSDEKPGDAEQPHPSIISRTRGDRAIWCAACKTRVSSEEARIAVDGGHRHVFTNPAGFSYEIGCFSTAEGCVVRGEPSAEATWFAGCAWSCAHCANCTEHLGWSYEGRAAFFGLILERLMP
jgi:hypothetical protein